MKTERGFTEVEMRLKPLDMYPEVIKHKDALLKFNIFPIIDESNRNCLLISLALLQNEANEIVLCKRYHFYMKINRHMNNRVI
mmetsp:Transcript_4744/g.8283  ORF Transcript_4744/g.8283 Transcript_4744/m.8283 type:complete len:83 (+) Transcript_4744:1009-1257(+)